MAARTDSTKQPVIIDNVYYDTIVLGAKALKVSAVAMQKAIKRARTRGMKVAKVHGIDVIIVSRDNEPEWKPRLMKEEKDHRKGEPLLPGLVTHRLGGVSSGRY